MQGKKKITQAVAVRDFFSGGRLIQVGEYVTGAEAAFLVSTGKCRPYDADSEVIVTEERDGEAIKGVRLQEPSTKQAAKEPQAEAPNKAWTGEQIREWIADRDPGTRVPPNAGKATLLRVVEDLQRSSEV